MVHITEDELARYVDDQLDEIDRQVVEDHLDVCDLCFDQYLNTVEAQTLDVSLTDDFTEQTINIINQQSSINAKSQSSSYPTNKVLINYLLAAGLTIVLMVTGVFQNFLTITDRNQLDSKPSITEELMERTNTILDDMKGEYK